MNKVTGIYQFWGSIIFLQILSAASFAQSKETMDAHKHKWGIPTSAESVQNPFAHESSAADSGKAIYMKICSVCHGNSGKGDGVAAAGLSVKPANHTSENVQMMSDGDLFYELSNGHAPMPAYKSILKDKERWELVSFIRTLKPASKKPKK